MSDAFEGKMRDEWNERAKKSYMQYTSGTQTEREEDYVESAKRDAGWILKLLGPEDTSAWRALDLGCGVGRIVTQLAPRFGEVHGVDVSDEMLRHAKERHASLTNVHFHRIGGKDLREFPDSHFQMMWSYSVLYHMPRELFYGYLKELGRVMAPGGRMIFQLAQLYSFRRWWQAIWRIEPDSADTNVRRFYTKGHLRRLADAHGFDVLACEPGPGHDLWNSWRKR